ncbi:hypothetical protein CDQ92_13160 [Sphingopyxis bauzanensis]|uniref:B30.2/SPRY domain-containing protein n=1 Tax=Sphingopyxis bauzanensis TaxID=651663 RepID=A0A246JRT3_9SPHN|nr:hypothetical protein CDQ92_13160 [Sphingopyxis bauzanensis]
MTNGQTVKVRLTTSASYSTIANAALTIGGVSDTFSVTTEAEIPTPAITKTSASGDIITFSVDAIPYVVGYYWNLQIAGDSGFTTNYPTEGAIRDETRIVTIEDLTDDDVDGTVELDPFTSLDNQKAGAAYLRIRLGRDSDDGLSIDWGAWSNTITDTVVVLTPTTFDASAAYSGTVLTNGNLTATSRSQNTGQHGKVRVTQSRTGKRFFQMTLDAMPSTVVVFGVGPSTYGWTALNANYPGTVATPDGISLSQGGVVLNNGASTSSVTPTLAAGAIVSIAFDTTAGKVWYGYTAPAGSTITWNGDPAAGTGGFSPAGMTDWYAYASMLVKSTDQRQVTFNGGASAFVGTIPSSFVGYDL